MSASTASKLSSFIPINAPKPSTTPKDSNHKFPGPDPNDSASNQVASPTPSKTGYKRKRAQSSKAARKHILNVPISRQPHRPRKCNTVQGHDMVEPLTTVNSFAIDCRTSGKPINNLLESVPQEEGGRSQTKYIDETHNTELNIRGENFWAQETDFDQYDKDLFAKFNLETRSLNPTDQESGFPGDPRYKIGCLPSQQASLDKPIEITSGRDGPSPDTFLNQCADDFLDPQKFGKKSLEDDCLFDIHIDDYPWINNTSPPLGDEDEYPMDEDDAEGLMELAEVEKMMVMTENSSIAHAYNAGKAFQPDCIETTDVMEHKDGQSVESYDVFLTSLQDDWSDGEPKANATDRGSITTRLPFQNPNSFPFSNNLDPAVSLKVEGSRTIIRSRTESFDDDEELDRELLNLENSTFSNINGPPPSTPPSSPVPVSISNSPPLEKPTLHPDIPHIISFDSNGKALPFIRPPFAKPVRDRSTIHDLRSQTVLRPCFRIGEALNAGCTAARSDLDAVIELYARVTSSTREPGSSKQRFQFADLFTPDKPPFLNGVYALWRGVELWDRGSKVFLGEAGKGQMARVVGRIRKEEGEWLMNILCVWQVDWEEVGLAKGIVCS